jgi:hypothetical protein
MRTPTINEKLTDRLTAILKRICRFDDEQAEDAIINGTTQCAFLISLIRRSRKADDRREWNEYVRTMEERTDEDREADDIRAEQESVYYRGLGI